MLCLLETILGWINYGPYNMYAFLKSHITAQRTDCPLIFDAVSFMLQTLGT